MHLDLGRTSQKARTRRDLLAAARRVLDRGQTFSVNAVADEAAISRATAYRYFSDPDALMLEAVLDGQFATPEEVVGDAEDTRERVHRVQRYLSRLPAKRRRGSVCSWHGRWRVRLVVMPR